VYLQMVNKHYLIFCNFKSVVIGEKKVFLWNLRGVNNIHFFGLLSVIVRLCMSQEYIYSTLLTISNSRHFSPLMLITDYL
jgi:hypothetical protein